MAQKLNFAIRTKYGVVTEQLKGVVVVGKTPPDITGFKTISEMVKCIKDNKLPVCDDKKPVYEFITSIDEMKRYIDDNKLVVDKRLSLEDMRKAVKEDTELKEKIDAEESDISVTR